MNYLTQKTLITLITILSVAFPAIAGEPVNLAGVYEGVLKNNAQTKRIYANIDFINGTKDFTQVFSGKESKFKMLPADFMNAKKLKKNWAGQTAPGFVRFNEKVIFSSTTEAKITNPVWEDGVIFADWEDASGNKGKCYIISNPDRTLQILGLGKFYTRDGSPDNMMLTLVEDRLPQGAEPYVTPPAVSAFLIGEYQKNFIVPTVKSIADDIDMQVYSAVQKGNTIEIDMRARNMTNYDRFYLLPYPGFQAEGSVTTDKGKTYDSFLVEYNGKRTDPHKGEKNDIPMKKGEWVKYKYIVTGVNERVDKIPTARIETRTGGIITARNYLEIENLPVMQDMPDDIKPAKPGSKDTASAATGSSASAAITIPSGKYVLVNKGEVNMRTKPSTSAPVADKAEAGRPLKFLGEENGWLKVENPANNEPVFISATVAKVVKTAPLEVFNNEPDTPLTYSNHTLNTDPTYGFESYSDLQFHGNPETVYMLETSEATYMDGRMRSNMIEYRGKLKEGYVEFSDKKVGIDGEWEPIGYPVNAYAGPKAWTLIYNGVVYDAYQYDPETDQGWKLSE